MTGRADTGLGAEGVAAVRPVLGDRPGSLAPEELDRAIRAADPNAFPVEPRVLRRVVRLDLGVGLLGRLAGGRRSYAIAAGRAAGVLAHDELGLPEGAALPDYLILIARPDPEDLAGQPAPVALRDAWRLLFYARVLAAFKALAARGGLDLAAVRRRIDRIGQPEFDEVRAVLRQDHYLPDVRDPIRCYVEFAALYAKLRWFAPGLLPRYFPSIDDPERIDVVLAEDADLSALLARCRPVGAADLPGPPAAVGDHDEEDEGDGAPPGAELGNGELGVEPWVRTRWVYRFLIHRANRAAARGNHVRAAIRRLRAARFAPEGREMAVRDSARRELERLAERLGPALGLDAAEAAAWRKALPALAGRAGRGVWSREARLLYDLQKVVIDHERDVYTVDLVEWALTLGRRPIVRPLPLHREVLIVQHLVAARRRLERIRLPEADRDRLTSLLGGAVEQARRRLRDDFRPVVAATLERTGWLPANLPERVALGKLTEELLDRIVDRGFLNMGDLRDAISRSNLKLPDLAGPVEFWRGDRLLRTDRALAVGIDGVYRRGEIYLRWLQRASSLAFGTRVGRLFTLFVALPFGASYVVLEGLDHLAHSVTHWLDASRVHVYSPGSFLALGLLLVGLVNSLRFRRAFVWGVRRLVLLTRRVVLDLPSWALGHPLLRLVVESPPVRFLARWVLKPSLFALGTLGLLRLGGVAAADAVILAGVAFVASAALLNSRTGRDVEEILADRAVRLGQRLVRDLIPGLFRLVVEVFDRLLEALERVHYAIDEWLRFKSGQGPLTLASKAVVGLAWFLVAYVVRAYVILLIEPQVNPIKHFPVVTVSHKLMIPFLKDLLFFLRAPLLPLLGPWVANTIAGATLFLLPGVFGFLVWELKENWKLYEANRARNLRPVIIGHHGETMARLLRPGLHSGTIPKLYARLRRAGRRDDLGSRRRPRPSRKYRERLRHVEAEVRAFIDRELIALLALSRVPVGMAVGLGRIRLGTNRVRVALNHRGLPDRPLVLAFEEQSGWLVAGIVEPGWLDAITAEERDALRDALAGLYKLAGVDLVREQIEALLGPSPPPYDIVHDGLVIWPDPGYHNEVIVGLDHPPVPAASSLPLPGILPRPDVECLLFSRVPLPWSLWVKVWERDRRGEGHPRAAVPGVRLLPGPEPDPAAVGDAGADGGDGFA